MGGAMFFWRVGAVILVLAIFGPVARADVAAQFPATEQVMADYPGPVERYVALSFLWDRLHTRAEASPEAVEKLRAYYAAMQDIAFHYAGGTESFKLRVAQVETPDFGRAVLKRYHVPDAVEDRLPAPEDAAGEMIKRAYFFAAPFVIAFVIAVALWLVTRRRRRQGPRVKPADTSGGGPPEN